MWRQFLPVAVSALLVGLVAADSRTIDSRSGATASDTQAWIIEESISSFRGTCPCPFSWAPDGKRCGERSAYSTTARQLKCYPADVTSADIAAYVQSHKRH